MDTRKTRAAGDPAGAARQSENARARSGAQLGISEADLVAAQCGDGCHADRAARRRSADGARGGRRGHGADPQRKRRARKDRRLRQGLSNGEHNALVLGDAHRPAHFPESLGARLRGRESATARSPPQPAVLRRGRRSGAQGASAAGLQSLRLPEARCQLGVATSRRSSSAASRRSPRKRPRERGSASRTCATAGAG